MRGGGGGGDTWFLLSTSSMDAAKWQLTKQRELW